MPCMLSLITRMEHHLCVRCLQAHHCRFVAKSCSFYDLPPGRLRAGAQRAGRPAEASRGGRHLPDGVTSPPRKWFSRSSRRCRPARAPPSAGGWARARRRCFSGTTGPPRRAGRPSARPGRGRGPLPLGDVPCGPTSWRGHRSAQRVIRLHECEDTALTRSAGRDRDRMTVPRASNTSRDQMREENNGTLDGMQMRESKQYENSPPWKSDKSFRLHFTHAVQHATLEQWRPLPATGSTAACKYIDDLL
ncbi:uncharacterized protein LOC125176376 [Prionailurus viverrinus]|uniref:uncharacterized protein LOC125176376 n=1 Tax=Prionailurus viverrinus TaxID=61388 RepID=UPI001FF2A024|nr:uncharacterized protein LOC125176376 [Prionailurus viverrinus]